jgi:hypothetical protein
VTGRCSLRKINQSKKDSTLRAIASIVIGNKFTPQIADALLNADVRRPLID